MEEEIDKVIDWVKVYVEKCNAKGVVIGNSGGKDSAVVLAIAKKALGEKRVLAVGMPCLSRQEDLEDAKLVADLFNVKMIDIDLSITYSKLEEKIEESMKNTLASEAKVNIKPRLRMTTLYAIAQTLGYLVIGTGNLSEATVGYTTKWGDNACDFNPIAQFTAEEVLEMAKLLGVPSKIINKAPADGLGTKTDEEKMGVLYSQISEYIKKGYTEETAMRRIQKLNKKSEHKRRPIPVYERK